LSIDPRSCRRKGTEKKPWIACDSRLFLLAVGTGGDVMEHSVLQQALQALSASDEQIVQLLTLRQHLASQLAQACMAHRQPLTLEQRISTVVSRLARCNSGPLDNHRIAAIFEMVIRVTEPLSIGLSPSNGAAKKG
jgi:chorismate mutase